MRWAIRETCPSTCPVTCDGAKRRKVNGMANFCVLWGSLYHLKTSTEARTSRALRSHTVRIWQVWSKTYTNHGWYEVIDKGKDQGTVFLESWQWKWNKHEAITLVFLFPVSKMLDLYLKRPREERDAHNMAHNMATQLEFSGILNTRGLKERSLVKKFLAREKVGLGNSV